jgi:hypothetical protein
MADAYVEEVKEFIFISIDMSGVTITKQVQGFAEAQNFLSQTESFVKNLIPLPEPYKTEPSEEDKAPEPPKARSRRGAKAPEPSVSEIDRAKIANAYARKLSSGFVVSALSIFKNEAGEGVTRVAQLDDVQWQMFCQALDEEVGDSDIPF